MLSTPVYMNLKYLFQDISYHYSLVSSTSNWEAMKN